MLTPLEIHNKEFKRSFRGYDEEEVDEFLDQVIADYEQLYRENMDLRDDISKNEGNIGQYKDLEDTLKNALVVAQQTSDKMKSNAEKEAQMIVQEANTRAERIVSDAQFKFEKMLHDHESLKNQVKLLKIKLKSFLELQIGMIEEYDEGILKEEIKGSTIIDEIRKNAIQEVDQEVSQEVFQMDGLNNNISEIVAEEENINKLNTYDLQRNESGNESFRQNTVIFSKEEIAAAIDEETIKDKTIY